MHVVDELPTAAEPAVQSAPVPPARALVPPPVARAIDSAASALDEARIALALEIERHDAAMIELRARVQSARAQYENFVRTAATMTVPDGQWTYQPHEHAFVAVQGDLP